MSKRVRDMWAEQRAGLDVACHELYNTRTDPESQVLNLASMWLWREAVHIALLQPGLGSHKGGAQVLVHSIAYEGKVCKSLLSVREEGADDVGQSRREDGFVFVILRDLRAYSPSKRMLHCLYYLFL